MRCLVFGIDGATWEILDPLLGRGELPNLASLCQRGVRATLRSTLPPQSAPAWVSLATGQNPGRHGVFDFYARDLREYDDASSRLNQSGAQAGRTLWDYAGVAGMRVGVVSMPLTYPAWPVNGFLVSGSLNAPGAGDRSAYPPELAERYASALAFPAGYRQGASREAVMRDGPAMIVRRKDAVLELLARHPVELLVVVMGEVDKAQHDFWRYIETDCPAGERRRFGDVIYDHYRAADRALGEILDAFGRDSLVAVVSDHGAGPYPRRAVRTNAWLRERGLLSSGGGLRGGQAALQSSVWRAKRLLPGWLRARLQGGKAAGWLARLRRRYTGLHDVAWSQTQAFRVPLQIPAEGIELNLRGRQPAGVVSAATYEAVLGEVALALGAFTDPDTGEPVISEVHQARDVYQGPYWQVRAPDLVFVLRPGYGASWGNDPPVVVPVPASERAVYRGAHTMDGVLILSGPGIRSGVCGEAFSILDVAPTLLHALGLAVPRNMDGRVLLDVFEGDCGAHVCFTDPLAASSSAPSDLSPAEEEEIAQRLRGLGYLE